VNNLKKFLKPLVCFFEKINFKPIHLTFLGLFLSLIPSIFYAINLYIFAGISLILFSLFDALDGELARKKNEVTKFGGVIDSTFDRISEGFIFSGILYSFKENLLGIFLSFFSLLSSFMISYVRARGEGEGFSTRKGPMERSFRILYISFFSFFGKNIFLYSLIPFIILNLFTFTKRVFDLKKNLI
jgi:CDP-diacylglycerol--glycerol-3-phosphate 3-phosphatidyltransferase